MTSDLIASRRQLLSAAATLSLGGALAPLTTFGQDASPRAASSEEEAVGMVLFQMAEGFAELDAEKAAEIYTDDSEWINAFGDRATGRQEIKAKLFDVFSSAEYGAGQVVSEPSGSVRVLTDDTAIGWTYQEIEGQLDRDGAEIPLRRNHSLAVLVKQDENWLITAHMFMDENMVD